MSNDAKSVELLELIPKHAPSGRCKEALKQWHDAVKWSEAPESDIQLLLFLKDGIWQEDHMSQRRIPVFQITNAFEKSPDYGQSVIVCSDSLTHMLSKMYIWPTVVDQFKRLTVAQLGVIRIRGTINSDTLYKIEAEHIKHFFK